MKLLLLVYIFLIPKESVATYETGKAAAEGSVSMAQRAINSKTLAAGGLTVSEHVPEARFQDGKTLQQEGDRLKVTHPDYHHIRHSQEGRLDYTFDVDTPLSKVSDEAGGEVMGQQFFVSKTCRRGGQQYLQTCKRERLVTLEVLPEIGHHTPRFCLGHWNSWGTGKNYCGGCRGGDYVVDRPKTVNKIRDEWVGCEVEESLRDSGAADLESLSPGEVENPRMIQGEPVSGDIWEETRVYRVGSTTVDQCASLRILGCVDEGGTCIQPKVLADGTSICLEYEHTFRCPAGKTTLKRPKDLSIPESETPTYVGNQNMAEALARMEALKQASLGMEKNADAVISIFKGEPRRCSTNFGGSFKDCCKSSGGFGVRLRLATACTPEEHELADWRSQKRCVFVGSRQTKNTFGMNVSKEYVYCCFPTKMARAIQQGGRAQLRLGFGTAETPNCNGFTPHGLQQLDWGRLDLSDAFEDVMHSAKRAAETLQRDYTQKQQDLAKPIEKDKRQAIQEAAHDVRTGGDHAPFL
jgi:hypothetical protein